MKFYVIGTLCGLVACHESAAQDYRFTAGVHLNNSWGKDQYSRKIGDWKADSRSANIGVDLGLKTYPWLSTRHFVYLGGRLLVQHSDHRIVPEKMAGFTQFANDFGFSWSTWSIVARYGHRLDVSSSWSLAFMGGFSVGLQNGFTYAISGSGSGSDGVNIYTNEDNGRRFRKTGRIMPAVEIGAELFPLGRNRCFSVSGFYVQQLLENTPSQVAITYEYKAAGIKHEYAYGSRVRYANFLLGAHYYFGRLKGGKRVNKSNRDDCTSI